MRNKFSIAHRTLHWLIAFTLLFILLTIFLRQNWMNKNTMAEIISSKLAELDLTINSDQAKAAARAIRKPMWQWHIYAGYVLIGLYSLRMLLFTFQGSTFKNPLSKEISRIEKFQSWMYIAFYLLLGASLTTGMFIVFGPEKYEHTLEKIHVLSDYWLFVYIIIHFSGVLLAEFGEKKGIVSKMIGGSKNKA